MMNSNKPAVTRLPTTEEIQKELSSLSRKSRSGRAFKVAVFSLIVAAAIAVIVTTVWLPVLHIYGSSMSPTLQSGDIVVSLKTDDFKNGDVVGLYIGNRLLVKRIIAGPGQVVEIDGEGTVYIDGEELDEPYLTEKALGDSNITYPFRVPNGRYFVIGDSRATSLDSRSTSVGCIASDQIIGRVLFCVWPINKIGRVIH